MRCGYCDKELKGPNVVYDRLRGTPFCTDDEISVVVQHSRIVPSSEWDPSMKATALNSSKDSCPERYAKEHQIVLGLTIFPLSELEEEIELSKIRRGDN